MKYSIATFRATEEQARMLVANLIHLKSNGDKSINPKALSMIPFGVRDEYSAFRPAFELSRWDVTINYSMHFEECYTIDVTGDEKRSITESAFFGAGITDILWNSPCLGDYIKPGAPSAVRSGGSAVDWDKWDSLVAEIANSRGWQKRCLTR